MKKTIKMLAVAAMASMTIVACNNNKPAEEPVDTTAIEQVAEEQIEEPVEALDTVAQAVAEEAQVAAKKVAKKATKKDEPKIHEEKTTTDNAIKEDAKSGSELKTTVKQGGKFKRPNLK